MRHNNTPRVRALATSFPIEPGPIQLGLPKLPNAQHFQIIVLITCDYCTYPLIAVAPATISNISWVTAA